MDIWRRSGIRSSVAGMGRNAVLLAEHETGSREYLERHLRDDGFTVFEAAWTARALDLAERLSPDVVIAGETDLCRRLRAGEPGRKWNRNVPVIVLTELSCCSLHGDDEARCADVPSRVRRVTAHG